MPEATSELKALLYELRGDTPDDLVLEAAARVGRVMHDHMTRLGVWETAEPTDRAAVLWAMISGPGLATVSAARLAEDWRNLLDLVGHVIGLCDGQTHLSARDIQSRDSEEIYGRLLRLPEGWRQEVVRRIVGGANMASTIADAQMAINRLRSRRVDPTVAATPEFETAAG